MTRIQTTGKKPVYSLVLVTYINTDGAMFSETYFVVPRFFFIFIHSFIHFISFISFIYITLLSTYNVL